MRARPAGLLEDDGSIIVPMARDRLLEIFERVQRPGEVASTLEGALTGQLWQQQMLFQAMVDTWPRLQKALREVKLAARKAPWRVEAYARRGEKAKAGAEKLAREVEEMVWGMKPDPVRGLKGFEGTVEELAMGYFMGHHVLEPHWKRNAEGMVAPVSTLPVPPRFYGYPLLEDGVDRLMLDRSGSMAGVGGAALEDFPRHRFLIAVNGGHSGHPAQAAPLRVLTGYWLAAVYGLKWFMQFAQLFGIPFRWATYPEGDAKAKAELAAMMGNLGSQGWAAFKQGVEMNFLESGKGGGNLAQAELLRLADEQCDVFVLGQTLTSSQGDSGSQALGNVHMEVRREVVEGVCDFVGEILTHQLIPAMVAANYGESRTDLPGLWAKWPEPRDEAAMAQRDRELGLLDGKMPVERAWLYERHGVPVPASDAELFKAEKPEARDQRPEGEPGAGGRGLVEERTAEAQRSQRKRGEEGDGTLKDEGGTLNSEWEEEEGEDEPGREDDDDDATGYVVEAAFNPDQPRVPKGAPGGKGGEWTKSGGGGGLGEVPSTRQGASGADARKNRGGGNDGNGKQPRGGAHGKVKGVPGRESHHMPADSVSPIPREQGPSISMKEEHHWVTESNGSSKKAKAYRARQKALIEQGRFREAQQMDIDDVRSKFGDEYDGLMQEMQGYTTKIGF
ncbi:phage portal protein family protein [Luteolibacter soli]|uniref:phage portal protein family protein n=1 Tax=Luteolibacter soli TaxID=3135280 RepID=UPI0031194B30